MTTQDVSDNDELKAAIDRLRQFRAATMPEYQIAVYQKLAASTGKNWLDAAREDRYLVANAYLDAEPVLEALLAAAKAILSPSSRCNGPADEVIGSLESAIAKAESLGWGREASKDVRKT